ncbi:MAG: hypothetical protein P4L53_06915 [Candidatus Obscuribacterales bacterium]|nr:hypothetical protein [Candidatus Obscuribacterales bacterium]
MPSHESHLDVLDAYRKNVFVIALVTYSLTSSFAIAANEATAGVEVPGATTTSSTSNGEPKFEWTLEKMLMATAMPMTGEEREFLQTHRNLDGVRDWKLVDFKSYISTALGKKHVAEEAAHWKGIVNMLNKQATAGSAFMHEPMPSVEKDSTSFTGDSVETISNKLGNEVAAKQMFEQLKSWRQQISILAPFVESMRKKAEAKGTSEDFEKAIQATESNL